MKNKGLIIATIILLSIVIFFLTMFLVLALSGKINFRGMMFGFSKSTNVVFDEQFELDAIKSIEIKQDAGDIIIKETSNDYIQVVLYGEDKNDVKVDLNNGNLNIDYTHKKVRLFSFGGTKNDIIIYMPSSYSNEIKIKNDYGECEIADLENATVNIDCDAGNVNLGKVKNAIIKCDFGNIEVKEVLNKCEIDADCGNIKIDKISIKENSSIKADLGNIDINNTNDIYIDANVDLGKTNINNNNRQSNITLKINCDCGNVTINN